MIPRRKSKKIPYGEEEKVCVHAMGVYGCVYRFKHVPFRPESGRVLGSASLQLLYYFCLCAHTHERPGSFRWVLTAWKKRNKAFRPV
uniref:Uncharacterized protein n=1 Tax=Caenorhabditis tropicalis TaxID=1561998 RepID=A0A1I7U547_9PELO